MAERLRLSSRRTLGWTLALGLVLGLAQSFAAPAVALAQSKPAATGAMYASVESALDNGYGAFKSGYFERAVPALDYAASQGSLPAELYLAMIYADAYGGHTDHAKSYRILRKIAEDNRDIDPDDAKRAPFVGRAMTMLGGYLRDGIRSIRLVPDRDQALAYFHQAAVLFADREAQFELARINLRAGASDAELRSAKHFLSTLSQDGHAGAQALLADHLWQGRYMEKDQARALALITMALETAAARDLIWIEDIHQKISCNSQETSRKKAGGFVAAWRKVFGRGNANDDPRMSLGARESMPERTCGDGQPVGRKLDGDK